MPSPDAERLRAIKSFPSLVKYLRDELEWPIESEDFDDLTFDYEPEELGIDTKNAAKIKEIKQLRPLESSQPWGIFFVKFEPKQLPVVALRRILRSLVIKKRASAEHSQQATWQLHDLLFISSYGEAKHRDISFAHFSEDTTVSDLPTLKVLGWDDEDTNMHLGHADHTLKQQLRWPEDPDDLNKWRTSWSSAFVLRHREVINTSQQLAVRLADLARSIRKRVNAVLKVESEKGTLRKLMEAFRQALIHDLEGDDFADMYAQTIAYGLLSARVSRPAGLVADDVAQMVPTTNPFLRELMEAFLTVGGRKDKIDFDELGVSEVVDLLREANMEAVLRDFGDKNPQEDPVIHFYELFLKEYDAKKRMQRGVFYTPRPVVSFIVRSVDELLRTKFGLEDGLADTTTWGEMADRFGNFEIPEGTPPDQAFVQILDPATGTGTFLVEVIDLIHRTMKAKWEKEGHMPLELGELWNSYVSQHLLPRLHGYEIMMAPYTIAHMKIGIKLFGTGYRFDSDERARVFLTNALEPAKDFQATFDIPALAHEAEAVNTIKRNQRFTVVTGNPPYSGISANMTKQSQRLVDAYRIADGVALKEKKVWLQDDYVKFIRKAQMTIDNAGIGVLGYITNHGYIDNPTFRGMRQSLMDTFATLRILNLHGNTNKKEQAPDGSADKNVFDIRQGVAICLAARTGDGASISHRDLWGARNTKYAWLEENSVCSCDWEGLSPDSPFYFLAPQDTNLRREYERGWSVTDIFGVHQSGMVTARDGFVVGFTDQEISERIEYFVDPKNSDAAVTEKCGLKENYAWRVSDARRQLGKEKQWTRHLRGVLYRPFDMRRIIYHPSVVWRPRHQTMRHLDLDGNIALATTRSVETGDFTHVFCTNCLMGHHSVSLKEVNHCFPLNLLPGEGELEFNKAAKENIQEPFLRALELALCRETSSEATTPMSVDSIFAYIYAVLFSPGYRERYAAYLKCDFPRLPLTSIPNVFRQLAGLGADLIGLHLMKSTELDDHTTTLVGLDNFRVEKVSYSKETVWIDKAKTRGFRGVPDEVWNFRIGGYQVCEKWLKDRQAKGGKTPHPGRVLTDEDIDHYQKIIVALSGTIRIMGEIDEVIEEHGGWPGAFVTEPITEDEEESSSPFA